MATRYVASFLCMLCLTFATSCSSGGGVQQTTVTVLPGSAIVETGGTLQFAATVTGAANTAVSWSASCGAITAGGVYSAPAAPGSCVVTAISQADRAKSASATVTVTQPVVVTILPASLTISTGQTQLFTSAVTGSVDGSIIWSASCGTIAASGLYTAPATTGTCTVTAASHANPAKSAVVTVTVLPLPTVTISPNSVTMYTRQTQPFVAMVTGTNNQAVTWSANCGTISPSGLSSGLYTAPGTPGTCVVTATSQFDTSKSASVVVTLTAPPCSSDFAWLKFYAPENGTASGKAVAITNAGAIVAGVDSLPQNAVDPVAALVFYSTDGTEQSVWSNDSPSSITAMTYDLANDLVVAVGYVGDTANPGGRAGMLLVVSVNPPQILLNKTFQLEGARTEVRAIAVQGDKIYLAVNSDYQRCDLAQVNCSGNWIVVTDWQGSMLSKFAVSYSNTQDQGATSITGLVLSQGSLFVTDDLPGGVVRHHDIEQWSLDGQLLGSGGGERSGTTPVVDSLGNFYVVGTRIILPGVIRPFQADISVAKIDLSQLLEGVPFIWGESGTGALNYAKGAAPNSSGGLTVVGSIGQINVPDTPVGCAVSLDPNLNVLWTRISDSLPLGATSSWNAIAYDADGEALLVGTGSDGRTSCGQTPCPVLMIGRFCAPATP